MATDLTGALARLLSDPSLRANFARDPLGTARDLDVGERHLPALLAIRPDDLNAQARVLINKRLHETRRLVPRTFERIGALGDELFKVHAQSYWPTGHGRHVEDAMAFARFLWSRNAWFVDRAEVNRLSLLLRSRPLQARVALVRLTHPRPHHAVQVVWRRGDGAIHSWLLRIGLQAF